MKRFITITMGRIKKGVGLAVSIATLTTFVLGTQVGCDNGTTKEPGNSDTNTFDENGFNDKGDHINGTKYDDEGYNKSGYGRDGFNRAGLDKDGFNREGFNQAGFNRNGFNADGFDKNGFDKNGFNAEGWDKDGFDRNGYDADGFDRDGLDIDGHDNGGLKGGFTKEGIYAATGKPYNPQGNKADGTKWYDEQGYDFQGWNIDGWDRDGINKTGKPYDEQGNRQDGTKWYDEQGYDFQGRNIDGWDRDGYDFQGNDAWGVPKTVNPITTSLFLGTINNQSNAGFSVEFNRGRLELSATNVRAQFNQYGATNTAFRNVVNTACNYIPIGGTEAKGDDIVSAALHAISRYITEMVKQFPEGTERDKFQLVLETFRTRAYVNARTVGQNNPTANPSQAELQDLYTALGEQGGPNAANFDQYIGTVLVPELSSRLNISPVLVRTLLNQMLTVEGVYAIVDDISAMGYNPVMNNYGPYTRTLPIRNNAYVRSAISTNVQQQNLDMSN